MSSSSHHLKKIRNLPNPSPQFHAAFKVCFFYTLNLFPIGLLCVSVIFLMCCCFFPEPFLCCFGKRLGVWLVVFLTGSLLILLSSEVHLLSSCDMTDLEYLPAMCLSTSVPIMPADFSLSVEVALTLTTS